MAIPRYPEYTTHSQDNLAIKYSKQTNKMHQCLRLVKGEGKDVNNLDTEED